MVEKNHRVLYQISNYIFKAFEVLKEKNKNELFPSLNQVNKLVPFYLIFFIYIFYY